MSETLQDNPVIVIGAGPAGLAAALTLLQKGQPALCLEKEDIVGGLSRTIEYHGFRFDIGGHRFFTKNPDVQALWRETLPNDFLHRPRLSRIYFDGTFFDYPLRLSNVIRGLGLGKSLAILGSFLASRIHPYPQENSVEEWVSNRFGIRLYEIFFKTYTEKVWGIPCSQIQAEWASQRIKNLSLSSALKTALFGDKNKQIKTLIQEYDYPRFGPGQMYQAMADQIRRLGGQVRLNRQAVTIHRSDDKIESVECVDPQNHRHTFQGRHFISSMPIDELVLSMSPEPPANIVHAARQLQYRSLITVNLILQGDSPVPDNWIYIHSPRVRAGRIQFYKNWSPDMAPDPNACSIGMEYFCTENDELWKKQDVDLIALAADELKILGIAKTPVIKDAFVFRTSKTYPVYSLGYQKHLDIIKEFLKSISNLQCIGRNGMFKYNNMDHSILSGRLAAANVFGDQNDLWRINTDAQYHETGE